MLELMLSSRCCSSRLREGRSRTRCLHPACSEARCFRRGKPRFPWQWQDRVRRLWILRSPVSGRTESQDRIGESRKGFALDPRGQHTLDGEAVQNSHQKTKSALPNYCPQRFLDEIVAQSDKGLRQALHTGHAGVYKMLTQEYSSACRGVLRSLTWFRKFAPEDWL